MEEGCNFSLNETELTLDPELEDAISFLDSVFSFTPPSTIEQLEEFSANAIDLGSEIFTINDPSCFLFTAAEGDTAEISFPDKASTPTELDTTAVPSTGQEEVICEFDYFPPPPPISSSHSVESVSSELTVEAWEKEPEPEQPVNLLEVVPPATPPATPPTKDLFKFGVIKVIKGNGTLNSNKNSNK